MRTRQHNFVTSKEDLYKEIELELAYSSDKAHYIRLLAVKLVLDGHSSEEAANILGIGATTVRDQVRIADKDGVKALRPKKRPGRKRGLTDEQLQAIKEAVLSDPNDYSYDIWDGRSVADYIEKTFDKSYTPTWVRVLMKRELSLSFKKPSIRPCRNADSEDRAEFKKNSMRS